MVLVIKLSLFNGTDHIEVSIAQIINVAEDGEKDTYEVEFVTYPSKFNGRRKIKRRVSIGPHNRLASPWALVALAAQKINQIDKNYYKDMDK